MLRHACDCCRHRSYTCDSPIGGLPWKALAICLSLLFLSCGCQKQPATADKDEKPVQLQGHPKGVASTAVKDDTPWQLQGSPEEKMSPMDKRVWEDNKEIWKIWSEAPPLTVVRILSSSSLLGKWGRHYYVFESTDQYVDGAGDATGYLARDASPYATANRILRYSELEYRDLHTGKNGIHPKKSEVAEKEVYVGTYYFFPILTRAPPPRIPGFYLDLSAPLDISEQEAKELGVDRTLSK